MSAVAARPLEKLQSAIDRYLVVTEHQRLVLALWIVHTYFVHSFEQTPYLLVTSPEKQCGKSRLLELLELLVARPWLTFAPSEATLYRKINRDYPTLLLDEVDAIFNPRTADYHEGMRAIINSGHRRGFTVDRCVNFGRDLESFNVYGAKALAGIGTLPDTIADRSIPIRLQRKTRAEHVEPFRRREVAAFTEPIRAGLEKFATKENAAVLAAARPSLPDELSDRMKDGCEPLLAIADALGYGVKARVALVEILAAERVDSTERSQVRLLRSMRDVFAASDASALLSRQILFALSMDGWDEYYGRGLSARDLAALLRPYEIGPHSVRSGEEHGSGYRRDDFVDAWERYLTDVEEETEAEQEAEVESPA